jgi:hypothetical protein
LPADPEALAGNSAEVSNTPPKTSDEQQKKRRKKKRKPAGPRPEGAAPAPQKDSGAPTASSE